MKFKFLLFLLFRKLKGSSEKNLSFQEYIKDKTLKVLIKTADNRYGRLYIFKEGKISSLPGTRHEACCALVWSDPITAFQVMSSKNEEASLAALTERKLVVEGSYKDFAWFSRALAKMSNL